MATAPAPLADGILKLPLSPAKSAANVLYYGDNLDVLRRHIKDESVDLVAVSHRGIPSMR